MRVYFLKRGLENSKMSDIEIFLKLPEKKIKLKAVIFDFDGTLSTLRHGWEKIMEPLMIEMISGNSEVDEDLLKEVKDYINQSTGLQTYYQMKWLAEAVKRHGKNTGTIQDPWWYKAEYNRRLMEPVNKRIKKIQSGKSTICEYLIRGSKEFLEALFARSIEIYVASGTDHPDVNHETEVLGLKKYFKEVSGAPLGEAKCSKEAVIKKLLEDRKLNGSELVVIGDGKIEIALGRQVGAVTLGVASDEEKRCGVNFVKKQRLIKAGAHAIVGDFRNLDELLNWLGL